MRTKRVYDLHKGDVVFFDQPYRFDKQVIIDNSAWYRFYTVDKLNRESNIKMKKMDTIHYVTDEEWESNRENIMKTLNYEN